VGILSALSLAVRTLQGLSAAGRRSRWTAFARVLFMIGVSLAIYGIEIVNAVALIRDPSDTGAVFALATLILAVYGIGLVRAWELLGAPRTGLSGWLNPLRDLEDDEERAASDARDAATQANTARSARPRSES
jgi:hypothetical protein